MGSCSCLIRFVLGVCHDIIFIAKCHFFLTVLDKMKENPANCTYWSQSMNHPSYKANASASYCITTLLLRRSSSYLFFFLIFFFLSLFLNFSFGVVIALSRCNRDTLTVARQRTMVPEPSGWPTSTLLSFPRAIELGGS